MRFSLLLFLFPIFLHAMPGFQEPWGKDADLIQKKEENLEWTHSPMGFIAEKVILFNQNFLSPTYGPRSNFRPTSSRYMLWAIRRHGFIKGFFLGCDRLLRENDDPWVYQITEIDGKLYKWDPPPR